MGGSLTENTTIDGNYSYELTPNYYNILTTDSITYGEIYVTKDCSSISWGNETGSTNVSIYLNDTNSVLINDSYNQTGAKYAADYSANFTARSIVDKEYVDAHSGSSLTDVMQVAKATVLYTNTGQTTIVTLQQDAIVLDMGIKVKTAFNASGNDLNIGITTDYWMFEEAYDAAFYEVNKNTDLTNFPYEITTPTDIVFDYNPTGTGPTQGEGIIFITYVQY